LATRNDTSEQIPTEIFDSALVKTLMKNKIYTLKVDARQDQLKQIKWDQQMGIGQFNLGNLKSPNYFVKSRIDENMFRSDGQKVVEQSMNVEFIHLESLAVMVSEKETFSKKAKDNQGLGW
ncbi:MAG TPA: penicillin-binding protein activator LpoB, partial [Leptospiraceae bacterium]|nr:penicillin-binding protein activator LpoB [Leptospiraceae bacterium]